MSARDGLDLTRISWGLLLPSRGGGELHPITAGLFSYNIRGLFTQRLFYVKKIFSNSETLKLGPQKQLTGPAARVKLGTSRSVVLPPHQVYSFGTFFIKDVSESVKSLL